MTRDLLTHGGAPAVPRDANVISLEILMRERGWRTGDWIWRGDDAQGGNEGWAVYLGRRFSVFLPLAISRRVPRDAFPSSSLSPRITAFISSLSGYFILLPRGRSPRVGGAPTRVYPLSSRNNKLTLLNLSWAAFRSSSLRQQRAPAYLPTNIVTAFNSVIYLVLHAF